MSVFRHLWSTSHRAMFLRFASVATMIAVIDIAILYLLHVAGGLNVYLARLVSYGAAMTAGYFLNSRYTFYHRRGERHLAAEISRFYLVFGVGGLINYAIFAAIVAAGDVAGVEPTLRFWLPLIGIQAGGVAGMAFNYGFSHKLVFQSR